MYAQRRIAKFAPGMYEVVETFAPASSPDP
jgi:hypothetical protein